MAVALVMLGIVAGLAAAVAAAVAGLPWPAVVLLYAGTGSGTILAAALGAVFRGPRPGEAPADSRAATTSFAIR